MIIAFLIIYLVLWLIMIAIGNGRYLYLRFKDNPKELNSYTPPTRLILDILISIGAYYENSPRRGILEWLTRLEDSSNRKLSILRAPPPQLEGVHGTFQVLSSTRAERCEICHQSDLFDLKSGFCRRCHHTTM